MQNPMLGKIFQSAQHTAESDAYRKPREFSEKHFLVFSLVMLICFRPTKNRKAS